MVATGDLLAGVKNASSGQLMDSMYTSWNLDPVHGVKVAYTRIGLSLLDSSGRIPPGSRGTASAPRRGRLKTTARLAATVPEQKIEAATVKTGSATGGTSRLPPAASDLRRPQRFRVINRMTLKFSSILC
jgi:hypothetical protein